MLIAKNNHGNYNMFSSYFIRVKFKYQKPNTDIMERKVEN